MQLASIKSSITKRVKAEIEKQGTVMASCTYGEEKDSVVLDNDFAECMLTGMFAYACNLLMISFAVDASMLLDHRSASLYAHIIVCLSESCLPLQGVQYAAQPCCCLTAWSLCR